MTLADLLARAEVDDEESLEALSRALLRRNLNRSRAWRCVIPLPPMGKPSHRNYGRQTDAAKKWRRSAHWHLLAARPPRIVAHVPVICTITSVKARPKSLRGADPGLLPCPKKPDADNVSKMVKDCATKARVWADDNQVVDLRVLTFYAELDGQPRVMLEVEVIDDELAWVDSVMSA